MESVINNSPRDKDISNISTLYVNSLTDKIFDSDTEADFTVNVNVDWERKGLNKISCTSLSIPISNYIVSKDQVMTLTVTDFNTAEDAVATIQGSGMIDSAAVLVKQINELLFANNPDFPENYFKYDYDPAIDNLGPVDPSTNYNDKMVSPGPFVTGRIWSNNRFTIKLIQGATEIAPILGLKSTTDTQLPILFGTKFAMPYIADIIPYSIIYLACSECNNGIQSSNGTNILASLFYNNEKVFTYMRQDFALESNAKWLTRKTNTLHFYFLDENKKRIKDFNGIAAFLTICLFNDSSEPRLK